VSAWLLVGIALHLVGLAVTFGGTRLAGRLVGLALVSAGAGLAVIAAPPVRSWPATVTIVATLVLLVVVAAVLRRRVSQVAGSELVTIDDDAL
jgi:hypothetical protein